MHDVSSNPVFEKYGLPGNMTLGSNTPGPHPSSTERPVHYDIWDEPGPSGYRISPHMINEPPPGKRFKILVIGAGAAGIDFLHSAPKELESVGVDIVCYDKNPGIGGTWFENRYPGCACDVPSVMYTFPWKPNPHWSKFYSSAPEILGYLKDIVEEEGMMKYIKLNTTITKAVWTETESKWRVWLMRTVNEAKTEWEEEFEFLINGAGVLNAWRWPEIPGIESFKGDLFHTANYKEHYDMKGKRVAVVGSGSSGVQVCASIVSEVAKLYTWVRSPVWITASLSQQFAGENGTNFHYTTEQKKAFDANPEQYHRYHKMIEYEQNKGFRLMLRNSKESDEANAYAYKQMSTKLQALPELKKVMIPDGFNVGCRRVIPGNGYLEALTNEKTTVFSTSIQGITERGVVDSASGQEYEVDAIICATGFDTSYRPRFPLIGLDAKTTMAEKWSQFPESYLGVSVDGFPNYFTYIGPFTPIAQGSLLPIITLTTRHIIEVVKKMRREHIRRLSPKPEAVANFIEHAKTYLGRTCWADPCSSWYKLGAKYGTPIMWPGSRMSYFEAVLHPRFEDYEIQYWSGNIFGYLGSGFADYEFNGTKDTTWYLDEFSDRKEWVNGVPFGQDPDEFRNISIGALPATQSCGRPSGEAPMEVVNGLTDQGH